MEPEPEPEPSFEKGPSIEVSLSYFEEVRLHVWEADIKHRV